MSPTFHRQASLLLIVIVVLVSLGLNQPVASQTGKVFRVTTTEDINIPSTCTPGEESFCSLRQALNAANLAENAGSTITFFIPESDNGYQPYGLTAAAWFIQPASALPAIRQNGTIIDGSTQTQNLGDQNKFGSEIIIIGSPATSSTAGLTIRSDNNRVQNLGIANFSGTNRRGIGIEVYGSNNTIQGNYIGVSLNASGAIAQGNGEAGIVLRETAQNNIIGGDNALQTTLFNVIAGNELDGILIDGGKNNIIQSNYIGIAVSSQGDTITIPNKGSGIQIRNFASGNRIGSIDNNSGRIFRNFISGNQEYGIYIKDSDNNEVYGNYIGIDPLGRNKTPNELGGIFIDGPLGTPQTPTANANKIGKPGFFTANYIAGNNGPGIHIRGGGAIDNQVVGNYIGVGGNNRVPSGEGPNNTVGVLIENGASNNTIGSSLTFVPFNPSNPADQIWGFTGSNFIAGNDGDGIRLIGRYQPPSINEPVDNNIIRGNCIGIVPISSPPFTQACNTALGNQGNGVTVQNYARETRIGDTVNIGNIISDNTGDGIYIEGSQVSGTTITSNVIGLIFSTGTGEMTTVVPNGRNGIFIQNAVSTLIGGVSRDEGNLVGGNTQNGIQLINTASTTLQRNEVGAIVSGAGELFKRGNGENGLLATGAFSTTLLENAFSYNGGTGVWFTASTTSTLNLNEMIDNVDNGVQFDLGSRYGVLTNNKIYSNTVAVLLTGAQPNAPQRIRIMDNSIARNDFGIQLDPATAGKPGNPNNPNHDIDPPIVDPSLIGLDNGLRLHINNAGIISGYVITSTNPLLPIPAGCRTCTVQVFAPDPSLEDPDGQGFVKVAPDARPDERGFFTTTLSDTTTTGLPVQIILTATDDQGAFDRNSSEFATLTLTRGVIIEPDRPNEPAEIAPTETYTYTHWVTNTGTIDDSYTITGHSNLNWPFSIEPPTVDLPAGEGQQITVTMTAPAGPDERVLAGLNHTLILTATSVGDDQLFDRAVDTTTVGAKIVLLVEPLASTGLTQAGVKIDFAHIITNNGNITATVTLSPSTDQLVCGPSDDPSSCWTVTLAETTYQLGPGQSVQPTLSVTPPGGVNAGAQAITTINVNVAEQPDQNKVVVDTTRVTTTPLVEIFPAGFADGVAGQETTFEHNVRNISNGPVTIKFVGRSSLGSTVTFNAATAGFTLNPDNSLTLSDSAGANLFTLLANVQVSDRARVGQEDLVTIQVIDVATGDIIASVQNRINITRASSLRIWLPLIYR